MKKYKQKNNLLLNLLKNIKNKLYQEHIHTNHTLINQYKFKFKIISNMNFLFLIYLIMII